MRYQAPGSKPREKATTARARRFGMADQMRHEQAEKIEREVTKARMNREREEVKRKARTKAAGRQGGTAGARSPSLSRISAFFGG